MTRRLAIATLAAFLAGYLVGQADASTSSPAPSAAVRVQSEQSGAPSDPALVPAAVATDVSPVGAPSPAVASRQPAQTVAGSATASASMRGPTLDPGTTAPSAETWTRQGIVNWAADSHGPEYLALPIGPGHRVSLCGPGGCLTLVSTDAGPDLAMQRAGRIADLAVGLWERISGIPRGYGGFIGTWTLVP